MEDFNGSCDYQCRKCNGRDDMHDIVVGVSNNATSSHLENCNEGTCASHECDGISIVSIGRLWMEFQQADEDDLHRLLAEHADVATYNPQRNAVQFRCDQGILVANLPLASSQVSALE
jgi:hypothetical protein